MQHALALARLERPLQGATLPRHVAGDVVPVRHLIAARAGPNPPGGIVAAVGAGKIGDDGKRQPMEVKAGDKIIYSKYSGTEVKLDDETYLVIGERDVLAVIEK